MRISRRGALIGAGAAAVVAGVPGAVDATTREVLEVFRQLNSARQELVRDMMRALIKAQRHNERHGATAADDAVHLQRRAGQ